MTTTDPDFAKTTSEELAAKGIDYLDAYTDRQAMWKSFELIDEIVQGHVERVISGHEPLVFKKERYP
jgi:tryptophan 2,3-dioxygenase